MDYFDGRNIEIIHIWINFAPSNKPRACIWQRLYDHLPHCLQSFSKIFHGKYSTVFPFFKEIEPAKWR